MSLWRAFYIGHYLGLWLLYHWNWIARNCSPRVHLVCVKLSCYLVFIIHWHDHRTWIGLKHLTDSICSSLARWLYQYRRWGWLLNSRWRMGFKTQTWQHQINDWSLKCFRVWFQNIIPWWMSSWCSLQSKHNRWFSLLYRLYRTLYYTSSLIFSKTCSL